LQGRTLQRVKVLFLIRENMQIKDMTPQELQSLIRNTVDDTLDEYFGDPDKGKQVKESFQQKLLEIKQKRLQGRATITAAEVDKRYGIEP
jgi:DNA-binding protein Fis